MSLSQGNSVDKWNDQGKKNFESKEARRQVKESKWNYETVQWNILWSWMDILKVKLKLILPLSQSWSARILKANIWDLHVFILHIILKGLHHIM